MTKVCPIFGPLLIVCHFVLFAENKNFETGSKLGSDFSVLKGVIRVMWYVYLMKLLCKHTWSFFTGICPANGERPKRNCYPEIFSKSAHTGTPVGVDRITPVQKKRRISQSNQKRSGKTSANEFVLNKMHMHTMVCKKCSWSSGRYLNKVSDN